jgi:hypothetical protein
MTTVSGTKRAFHVEVTSDATPEAIWAVWMDVPNWKHWDRGLNDARATAPLALGTRGTIVPRTGVNAAFEVTAFAAGKSYTFATDLIGAKLHVTRSIVATSPTVFRHEVQFTGAIAFLWAAALGGGFQRALPAAMQALAATAEAKDGTQ